MKRLAAACLLSGLLSAPAHAQDEVVCDLSNSASGFASTAHCPKAVKALLERQDGCEHFAGEEPYDAERAAFINAQMKKLKCTSLAAEKKALVQQLLAGDKQETLQVMVAYERFAHGELIDGAPIDNPDAPANAQDYPDTRVLVMEYNKTHK